MPIETECDCGRKLRLRDELAGKRVKCPDCGKPLTVPEAVEELVEAEDEPPPRPTAVRSRSETDRPPAVKRRDDDEEEDERPAKRRRDEDDEEEEEERPRPRSIKKKPKVRKKGGSSLPLLLGILAGVLVLLGGGGLVLWAVMSGGGGASADLKAFVPGDAMGFVSLRVSTLLQTEGGKALIDQAKQKNPAFDQSRDPLGLTPEMIDRVTVVFHHSPAADERAHGIMETLAPYDRSKAKSALTNPAEVAHEGKTYLAGTLTGQAGRYALYFASSKMYVFGGEAAVKRAISAAAKPRVAGPLDEGLALLGSRHFVGAFAPPPDFLQQMKQMAAQPGAQQFAPMGEFTSATLTASVGSALDLEAALKYAGDAQAQAAKGAADQGLATLRVALGANKAMFPPQMQANMAAMESTLNSAKIDQRGPRVVVTLKVEGFANMVKNAQGMLR